MVASQTGLNGVLTCGNAGKRGAEGAKLFAIVLTSDQGIDPISSEQATAQGTGRRDARVFGNVA
jgi:hypothetical protein